MRLLLTIAVGACLCVPMFAQEVASRQQSNP
jgi:hypothetical protein